MLKDCCLNAYLEPQEKRMVLTLLLIQRKKHKLLWIFHQMMFIFFMKCNKASVRKVH